MSRFDVVAANPNGPQGQVKRHLVIAGTTASIKAGEPVYKVLGATQAVAMGTSTAKPVVGTDYLLGIAASDSNETATAAGYVDVIEIDARDIWLGIPKVAATFGVGATPVQATYDALVGTRVLLDTTSAGACNILAADSATSGVVIRPIDVTRYPGKVAFSLRAGVSAYA